MIRLNELCKLTGVTRKQLRGYDEIGLLKPVGHKLNQLWLYDDDAVSKLMIILLFAELGYTRAKIKKILDYSTEKEFLDELDCAIALLEEKKRRITGMLSSAKELRQYATGSHQVFSKLNEKTIMEMYRRKSYKDIWNESVEKYGMLDETETQVAFEIAPATNCLFAIGQMRGSEYSTDQIRECVEEHNSIILNMALDRNDGFRTDYEKMDDEERKVWAVIIGTVRAKGKLDKSEKIEELLGRGAKEFIFKAFMDYGEFLYGEKAFHEIIDYYLEEYT